MTLTRENEQNNTDVVNDEIIKLTLQMYKKGDSEKCIENAIKIYKDALLKFEKLKI